MRRRRTYEEERAGREDHPEEGGAALVLFKCGAVEDQDVDIPEEVQREGAEIKKTREDPPQLKVFEDEVVVHVQREGRDKVDRTHQHESRGKKEIEAGDGRQVGEEQINLCHSADFSKHRKEQKLAKRKKNEQISFPSDSFVKNVCSLASPPLSLPDPDFLTAKTPPPFHSLHTTKRTTQRDPREEREVNICNRGRKKLP